MNELQSIYTGLDAATITPEELKQHLENQAKQQASVLDTQAAFSAWLEHPITKAKIARLNLEVEKCKAAAMRLSLEFDTNKDAIRGKLNAAQAIAWSIDEVLNKRK